MRYYKTALAVLFAFSLFSVPVAGAENGTTATPTASPDGPVQCDEPMGNGLTLCHKEVNNGVGLAIIEADGKMAVSYWDAYGWIEGDSISLRAGVLLEPGRNTIRLPVTSKGGDAGIIIRTGDREFLPIRFQTSPDVIPGDPEQSDAWASGFCIGFAVILVSTFAWAYYKVGRGGIRHEF